MTAAPVLFDDDDAPFDTVFGHALRGEMCHLVVPGSERLPVPIEDWRRRADRSDREILDHCLGPTIDIGCGPGRLTAELTSRGQPALGIDLVHEAVQQTRARGGIALRRDVFGPLPGEGRWRTALLADGNVGIGGDPVKLLRRVRRLLEPGGTVVIEAAPPGATSRTVTARRECGCARTAPFQWSMVGIDDVASFAARSGLSVTRRSRHEERWCAVLGAAA